MLNNTNRFLIISMLTEYIANNIHLRYLMIIFHDILADDFNL